MQEMRGFWTSSCVAFSALIASAIISATLQSVQAANIVTFKENVLYAFCNLKNCKDGKGPESSLVNLGGMLYGTTVNGGTGVACDNPNPGCGTVFSLDPNTGAETVLHSFCRELFCPDGASPIAGLIAVRGILTAPPSQAALVTTLIAAARFSHSTRTWARRGCFTPFAPAVGAMMDHIH